MKSFLIIPALLLSVVYSRSQTIDTIGHLNHAPVQRADSFYEGQIDVTDYFKLLAGNLEEQATAPFRLRGKAWLHVGEFGLMTGAIMFRDEAINHEVNQLRNHSHLTRNMSPVVTNFGGKYEIIALAALGADGLIFKNEKLKTTTLLATQAYLTSGLWANVIKFIAGRERPSHYNPPNGENERAWHGPFYRFKKVDGQRPDESAFGSFPSGHSTVAFAVATVFAQQYRDKPLVPIISYSAASLVALSRLTENKHWASDVFVGAALGYLSGRQVVGNYHHYRRTSSLLPRRKNIVNLKLGYNNGVLMPGMVYTFR